MIGREIRLASRPIGEPNADNFELVRVEVPEPGEGHLLVRNTWMSVDPYMRGRMDDVESYIAPFEIGAPLEGGAVAASTPASTTAPARSPSSSPKAAPEGIDVYLDLVGGDHLEAAIGALRENGRVALVGAISGYNATEPAPGPSNLFRACLKEATLRGMLVSPTSTASPNTSRWPPAGSPTARCTPRRRCSKASTRPPPPSSA